MNGLDELAGQILEAAGLTETDVDDVPSFGIPPQAASSHHRYHHINWPIVSAGENFFDKALATAASKVATSPM